MRKLSDKEYLVSWGITLLLPINFKSEEVCSPCISALWKTTGSLHTEADVEDDEEEGPWPAEAVSPPLPTPQLMSNCTGNTRLASWAQGRTNPVKQFAPPSSCWDHVLT